MATRRRPIVGHTNLFANSDESITSGEEKTEEDKEPSEWEEEGREICETVEEGKEEEREIFTTFSKSPVLCESLPLLEETLPVIGS